MSASSTPRPTALVAQVLIGVGSMDRTVAVGTASKKRHGVLTLDDLARVRGPILRDRRAARIARAGDHVMPEVIQAVAGEEPPIWQKN